MRPSWTGPVAQRIEHQTSDLRAAGSSPAGVTISQGLSSSRFKQRNLCPHGVRMSDKETEQFLREHRKDLALAYLVRADEAGTAFRALIFSESIAAIGFVFTSGERIGAPLALRYFLWLSCGNHCPQLGFAKG